MCWSDLLLSRVLHLLLWFCFIDFYTFALIIVLLKICPYLSLALSSGISLSLSCIQRVSEYLFKCTCCYCYYHRVLCDLATSCWLLLGSSIISIAIIIIVYGYELVFVLLNTLILVAWLLQKWFKWLLSLIHFYHEVPLFVFSSTVCALILI